MRLVLDYIRIYIIAKSMREPAVIGRSALVYCVGKPMEKSREFVNHSPAARNLQILFVFCQHPAYKP